jgi:hypothetical protein
MLIWKAATGYKSEGDATLSFEESFLVAPIVLHRQTRDSLPRIISTSLTVWAHEHPLERGGIAIRSQRLVAYTKEALLFGGLLGFLSFEGGNVIASGTNSRLLNRTLNAATEEVRDCAKRAIFVGRWFAQTGDPATVLALLGVRP